MADEQMVDTVEATIAADVAATEQPAKRSKVVPKVRTIFAVVFGLIAVIGLFASVLAVWARGVLFDADSVADAAKQALSEQGATDSLATYVTDEVFRAVDVEQRLDGKLPPAVAQYATYVQQGAYNLVEGQLQKVFRSEAVQDTLVTIVRRAHSRLLDVLQGDGEFDNVSIEDGAVTLNVLPLVELGLQEVQGLGLLDRFDIPALEVGGDPAAQIATLESTFGVDLPDDFGQLTVFEGSAVNEASAAVQQAQRAVVLVKRATVAIVAVTVVAIAASILLANRRRTAAIVLAIAAAVMMLVARVVIGKVVAEVPELVVDPGAREALRAAIDDLLSGLIRLSTWLLVIGVGVSIAVFLTGGSSLARNVRGGEDGRAGSVITRNNEVSGFIGLGLAVAVALLWGLSATALVVAGVIAAASLGLLVFGDADSDDESPVGPAPSSAG